MSRDEFEAGWDGRLILMARRASLSDLSRQFDITWFLGAIHKYRHLLTEVLVASFFLQVFSLVSPLFFQVVIDKVLVHRSIGTLEVLVIGLVTVSIFEAIIGALRTYVFAHTTNRSTSNSAPACSAISWRCRSPISRRGAWATRWRACASSRTSAIF